MKRLLLISLLPTIVLMLYLYRKDRVEKEPLWVLSKMFFFGTLTVLPAAVIEILGTKLLNAAVIQSVVIYNLIDAFCVVALTEELMKLIALYAASWRLSEFNCTFDAVVYAVFISLGFATPENIMYVFANGFYTGVVRAVLSVPGHMMFGIFMGLFYSASRRHFLNGRFLPYKLNLVFALGVPVLLHGFFDFLLFQANKFSMLIFAAFMVFLYYFAFHTVRNLSENDRYFYQSAGEPYDNC